MNYEETIGKYTVDDHLIESFRQDKKARLNIYLPEQRCVVLGRGSKVQLEVNALACQEDGIPLLRRPGGGCSVFLDEGNVIVSLVSPAQGFGRIGHYFRQISLWLISGLAELGLPNIRQEGISDLALGDHKVGGSCLYREKDLLYYSTTLLVNPQLELMERYLLHPPREPEYRQGRSHREFVTTLQTNSIQRANDMRQELTLVLKVPILD